MGITRRLRRLLRGRMHFSKPARSVRSYAASISGGYGDYIEQCRLATLDSRVFANFRRNPSYTTVLEHVSESQGKEYLRLLSSSGRASRNLEEAAKNDTFGNPTTIHLDSGVTISPTTLRYLKVADDLEKHFGNLDGTNIVEIGVGYGGQCRILDSLFKISTYTLVDLTPVLGLAAEFLGKFPLNCAVEFRTMNELAPRPYDVAISNYAFTELSRPVQEVYCAKVLEQSTKGYLTYNEISPIEYQSMTRVELCDKFDARVLPELPLTHPKNCLIVWGTRADREAR